MIWLSNFAFDFNFRRFSAAATTLRRRRASSRCGGAA
jgi:hypothetical protein